MTGFYELGGKSQSWALSTLVPSTLTKMNVSLCGSLSHLGQEDGHAGIPLAKIHPFTAACVLAIMGILSTYSFAARFCLINPSPAPRPELVVDTFRFFDWLKIKTWLTKELWFPCSAFPPCYFSQHNRAKNTAGCWGPKTQVALASDLFHQFTRQTPPFKD